MPFPSDLPFNLLTVALVSWVAIGSKAMDDMGVSSPEIGSDVDHGEGAVWLSST